MFRRYGNPLWAMPLLVALYMPVSCASDPEVRKPYDDKKQERTTGEPEKKLVQRKAGPLLEEVKLGGGDAQKPEPIVASKEYLGRIIPFLKTKCTPRRKEGRTVYNGRFGESLQGIYTEWDDGRKQFVIGHMRVADATEPKIVVLTSHLDNDVDGKREPGEGNMKVFAPPGKDGKLPDGWKAKAGHVIDALREHADDDYRASLKALDDMMQRVD